jgi:PAS domain S-box-containing protein
MQKKTSNMFQFFYRIILPALLAVVFFIITLFYFVIPVFEHNMLDRKREMIQELTNSATSILEKYHKDESEGLLSREEAQSTAISRIQYLRYGEENKDYFWITDKHPRMIMHPYVPELNGADLTDYEDSHGKKMFVEFVEAVKDEGHGFVEYMWQWKDDSTHVVPKLSYVNEFKPWGWIIGTGIYIEDVRKEISALSGRLLNISILIVGVVALLLTFISIQSLKIERRRQKAEQNLKESREKYRSLVEASTEGLLMISENKIIFANIIFTQMSGMSADEIYQLQWQSIFSLPEEIHNKLESGEDHIETKPFETRIYIPGNKEYDVLLTISPIEFYGRKALIFSVKDISTDIQMKQQLHESRERFKTLMDKLNVGIFRTTLDSRGKFIEVNQTAVKLLGFSDSEDLYNQNILDLFAEADDKKTFRTSLLDAGFIRNRIVKLIQSNGKTQNMMVSLAVITDEAGKAVYCDGIIEPVSAKGIDNTQIFKQINTDELRTILQSINISDISKPLRILPTSTSMVHVAQALNASDSLGYILVCDNEEHLLGYITHRELSAALAFGENSAEVKAYEIMKSPLIYVHHKSSVANARRLTSESDTSLLIVKDEKGQATGVITREILNNLNDTLIISLFEQMGKATDTESLKEIRNEFTHTVAILTAHNIHSSVVLQLLSDAFDIIVSRLFQLAFQKLGQAPCEFSWIVLGSEGRREQTLKTDQDNALIYSDQCKDSPEAEQYFLKLGTWMSQSLNHIGYELCKGDNMAMNPKWNRPLSVWKKYFTQWINTGQAKDLLDINIFFDFRLCWGNEDFIQELQQHIVGATENNPAFLHHLARNAIQSKLSVSEPFNIKDVTATLVNFFRIYAIQHGIIEKNTMLRLEKLSALGIIKESSKHEALSIFDFLTRLRLNNQSQLILEGKEASNIIQVKSLSQFDQSALKKALSGTSEILSKLNYDFRLNA